MGVIQRIETGPNRAISITDLNFVLFSDIVVQKQNILIVLSRYSTADIGNVINEQCWKMVAIAHIDTQI